MRRGDEAAHAFEVDEQTALVVPGHAGLDYLAGVEPLLQVAPRALLAGAVERQDGVALVVLRLHHRHEQRVTDCKGLALFGGEALQLVLRDNTLGLRADVHQDFVAPEFHDGAFNDVAVLECTVLLLGSPEQVLHRGVGRYLFEARIARGAHDNIVLVGGNRGGLLLSNRNCGSRRSFGSRGWGGPPSGAGISLSARPIGTLGGSRLGLSGAFHGGLCGRLLRSVCCGFRGLRFRLRHVLSLGLCFNASLSTGTGSRLIGRGARGHGGGLLHGVSGLRVGSAGYAVAVAQGYIVASLTVCYL